jgi:Translationally controlled tumour protein
MKNFSELQFFLGASFNSETMVFAMYPEGALTPNFYYILDAYKAEKF